MIDCAFNFTFWNLFYLKLFAPFFFLGCVICPAILPALWRIYVTKTPGPGDTGLDMYNTFINSTIACIVFFYTYIVITLSEPFYCTQQPDESWTLVMFPSMDCFDSTWIQNIPYLLFFIVLYIFVIPAMLAIQLYKNRKVIKTPAFKARYGSLTSPYSDEHFYWEFVVVTKKISLSLTLRVLSLFATASAQKFWVISFLFCSLILDIFLMPYNSPFRNQCNLLFTIFGIVTLLADAIVFSSATSSEKEITSLSIMLVVLYIIVFLYAVSHILSILWAKLVECARKKVAEEDESFYLNHLQSKNERLVHNGARAFVSIVDIVSGSLINLTQKVRSDSKPKEKLDSLQVTNSLKRLYDSHGNEPVTRVLKFLAEQPDEMISLVEVTDRLMDHKHSPYHSPTKTKKLISNKSAMNRPKALENPTAIARGPRVFVSDPTMNSTIGSSFASEAGEYLLGTIEESKLDHSEERMPPKEINYEASFSSPKTFQQMRGDEDEDEEEKNSNKRVKVPRYGKKKMMNSNSAVELGGNVSSRFDDRVSEASDKAMLRGSQGMYQNWGDVRDKVSTGVRRSSSDI